MTVANAQESDEAQIRALIDDRIRAVGAKDVQAAIASTAPDIVTFDVVNPLRRTGKGELEERTAQWFSSFDGPIGFDVRELSITAGGNMAFSHALHRYSGTLTSGSKIGMWVRATTCYVKANGTWSIAHEHQSVPFDPQTGAASLKLTP
ncbi:MAG: nuclear transport factor 2 family protein [Vulcanimicrobiaceae bacterium]